MLARRQSLPAQSEARYAPPPGPPPGQPRPVPFPFIHPDQIVTFYTQGYAALDLPPSHPLLLAAETLFSTSRQFFSQPTTTKNQYHISTQPSLTHTNNRKSEPSEEGWSHVPGEKELLTIRRAQHALTPPDVRDDAEALWRECGDMMRLFVRCVEESLGLEGGKMDGVVDGECLLPEGERCETMLRMFRYERELVGVGKEGGPGKMVATQHKDIGLLSLVIGSSPGLEVGDERRRRWVKVEEEPKSQNTLTVTLLTGMTLTRLTNGRYKPGVHRVFVPSGLSSLDLPSATNHADDDDNNKYRYSIVFALRPHRDAIISTSALTTPITGPFTFPLEGVRAQTLFNTIADAHWNINGGIEDREAQRLRLQQRKQTAAALASPRSS